MLRLFSVQRLMVLLSIIFALITSSLMLDLAWVTAPFRYMLNLLPGGGG